MATKITNLDETTGLSAGDIIPVVINPYTTPVTKKITFANLLKAGLVFLTTPLTSTSWDGDARSTEAATLIDLSAVFGVPAGVRAVNVRIECNDSAAFGTANLYASLGPSATYFYHVKNVTLGGDVKSCNSEWCNCDANGDIYYRIVASGAGTMDVRLEIWGYAY